MQNWLYKALDGRAWPKWPEINAVQLFESINLSPLLSPLSPLPHPLPPLSQTTKPSHSFQHQDISKVRCPFDSGIPDERTYHEHAIHEACSPE